MRGHLAAIAEISWFNDNCPNFANSLHKICASAFSHLHDACMGVRRYPENVGRTV
jgi:hypothetical protein